MKRLLAVGDLHGNFTRFASLWRKIAFDPAEDVLVFLGDYIDRCHGVRKCLEFVMELDASYENVICLRGNHEQLMLDYHRGVDDHDMWMMNGGDITDAELRAWEREETGAYRRVLDFAERCRLFHRVEVGRETYIFCHAGLDPRLPFAEQTDRELLWIRNEFYSNYTGRETVVVGHTPVPYLIKGRTTPIFLKNNIILVDTGSYLREGRISCVDVLTKEYWQSDDAPSR
ncbi:metallophosphoesterase family protein [Selenomonas sp. TAMA-11512]|uniref:metallophosphoesterase family protein n=1 Tax=Selenomonas sp. TAMA-11512 TaxID=3095337 RepID=UPI003093488B|nr:metallophosphoesterase family protein [Selenomonas sp. TAMA-11512]